MITNNFNSEEVLWMADYADIDMIELEVSIYKSFPNAKEITIDSIEPDIVYILVDGEKYTITPSGEVWKGWEV